MKVDGVKVTACEEVLVLPRTSEKDIVFRARAASVNEEFDKRIPEPIAPSIRTKHGAKPDLDDANYIEAVERRDSQRFALLCLRSLESSNIEWEQVDLDKPDTWCKWTDEMKESGLSDVEVGRVINLIMVANSLDEKKIEEARKAFLLGQGE